MNAGAHRRCRPYRVNTQGRRAICVQFAIQQGSRPAEVDAGIAETRAAEALGQAPVSTSGKVVGAAEVMLGSARSATQRNRQQGEDHGAIATLDRPRAGSSRRAEAD